MPFFRLSSFLHPIKIPWIFLTGSLESIKTIFSKIILIFVPTFFIGNYFGLALNDLNLLQVSEYLIYTSLIILFILSLLQLINPFSKLHKLSETIHGKIQGISEVSKKQKIICSFIFNGFDSLLKKLFFAKNSIPLFLFIFIFTINIFSTIISLASLYRIENLTEFDGLLFGVNFQGSIWDYLYIATREVIGTELYGISFNKPEPKFLLILGSALNIYIFAILILGYSTLTLKTSSVEKETENIKDALKELSEASNKNEKPEKKVIDLKKPSENNSNESDKIIETFP